MDWSKDMREMHGKFNVQEAIDKMDKETLTKFLKFRSECIQEEADELHHAISGKEIDAEETVDALIDIDGNKEKALELKFKVYKIDTLNLIIS